MEFDPDRCRERTLESGRKVLSYVAGVELEVEVEYAPTVSRDVALKYLKRVIERER